MIFQVILWNIRLGDINNWLWLTNPLCRLEIYFTTNWKSGCQSCMLRTLLQPKPETMTALQYLLPVLKIYSIWNINYTDLQYWQLSERYLYGIRLADECSGLSVNDIKCMQFIMQSPILRWRDGRSANFRHTHRFRDTIDSLAKFHLLAPSNRHDDTDRHRFASFTSFVGRKWITRR